MTSKTRLFKYGMRVFTAELLGTIRSEDEDGYEFSVLSMRITFGGRHFSKCACSERKLLLVVVVLLFSTSLVSRNTDNREFKHATFFSQGTVTGIEHFACKDSSVSQIFNLMISNGGTILSNVKVVVTRQVKRENSSLPVAVRGSKSLRA